MEPAAWLKALDQDLRDAYWKQKDIARTLALCQTVQDRAAECQIEADLSALKTLQFNVGSFLWPGWGSDGLEIPAEAHALGRQGATANLELAYRLAKPDLPRGRAHWLRGAWHLTDGEATLAIEEFAQAEALIRGAGEADEAALMAAYVALARDDGSLESARAALAPLEHGADFQSQIDEAARSLGRG